MTAIELTLKMQATDTDWTETEKNVAQTAFTTAYEREIGTLIQAVRDVEITKSDDLWHLNDLLSSKRHEMDGKYDYRYPSLLFVFAGLVKEGWLNLDELSGLHADKLAKISALARM
jgi:Photoprotection regulator fluorescence recovery protein